MNVKDYEALCARQQADLEQILRLRARLAGHALEGYLCACRADTPAPEKAAQVAVGYADAVILRLAD